MQWGHLNNVNCAFVGDLNNQRRSFLSHSKNSVKGGRFAERQRNAASPSSPARFGHALRLPKPLPSNGKPAKSAPKRRERAQESCCRPYAYASKAGAVMRFMIGGSIIRPMSLVRRFTTSCLPSGCLIAATQMFIKSFFRRPCFISGC